MLIGKIKCPDQNYHYRLYYNPNACKDAMFLPVYQKDQNTGELIPGSFGKVIFKSREYATPENIAYLAVFMASTYMRIVNRSYPMLGIKIDINDKEHAMLVKFFVAGIYEVFNPTY